MKAEDFFEVLGELDDDIVAEARSTAKENKNNGRAWVKWAAVAACFALVLGIGISFLPLSVSSPKGMYRIGTAWKTDQFTLCVVNATFCYEYRTETGNIITPGDDCRFIAVEYSAAYGQNASLSECTLEKGDAFSEPHTAYMEPIQLTNHPAKDGNSYILLFSIPLSESDADSLSQDSYTLRVEIDTGERTYVQDFSLAQ